MTQDFLCALFLSHICYVLTPVHKRHRSDRTSKIEAIEDSKFESEYKEINGGIESFGNQGLCNYFE